MKKTSVVFLDRDGVINEYPGHYKYVTCVDEFRLLPNVRAALTSLVRAGYRLFVVSNQAGVSKGLYTHQALDEITALMARQLGAQISFDGIFYCTHTSEEQCACRKPKQAFIEAADARLREQGLEMDRASSFFVGDSLIDVETGKKAGLRTIMVFSGSEKPENRPQWRIVPDQTAASLLEAVDLILS